MSIRSLSRSLLRPMSMSTCTPTPTTRLAALHSHLQHTNTPLTTPHQIRHETTKTTTMSPSTTMKAIEITQTGGPEVLSYKTDHPVPQPAEGQVLVQNSICGINYIDTYFRTGLYPSPKPEILGREGVGAIVSLGSGADNYGFKVGDRVAWLGTSGYAEYTAVPAAKTVKVPEGISDEDVMAGFLSGLTVLTLVKETYPVQKGETVLVHAAAGGAGSLMVQVLKSIGANVIGTAGGEAKCALAKSLGADTVIDYRAEDWVSRVKEATGGKGVDVVYDSVGKDTWEGALEVIKRKGTIVWFGNASGPVPPLPIQKLSPKNLKVARPQLFGYIETREEYEFYTNELFSLLKSGQLKVKVHNVYPLEQAAKAHIDLEGRKTTGKPLLKP